MTCLVACAEKMLTVLAGEIRCG